LELIRIALVDMPQMLREITRAVVEAEPGAEIVAEYAAPAPLAEVVRSSDVQFVVVRDTPEMSAEATSLLADSRGVGVLAISDDGRSSVLYELKPHRAPLGEVSPERLVDAIRSAVSAPIEG
jgi:DNA-binding NarL/FixJ family response regulator